MMVIFFDKNSTKYVCGTDASGTNQYSIHRNKILEGTLVLKSKLEFDSFENISYK